eukprot:scaffold268_cov134-Isochrysis_galbana.AAC.5
MATPLCPLAIGVGCSAMEDGGCSTAGAAGTAASGKTDPSETGSGVQTRRRGESVVMAYGEVLWAWLGGKSELGCLTGQ